MIRRLLLSAGVLALVSCGGPDPSDRVSDTSAAQAGPATAELIAQLEAGAFAHEVSDIPVDPNVVYGRLDNGMRYAILENDTPPQQAAVRLYIGSGSLEERDNQQGLAHFLEHMAFNGTTNVPEGEMIQLLERFGLAFGPDTNAFTSFDQTVYQLDLPEVNDEIVDTALFLMRETASEMLLDQGAIDRERGVIKSEERFRNSPGLRRIQDLWDFQFPDARFPIRFPIGTIEVIETASSADFEEFYARTYRPDNAVLVVVGDVSATDIEAKITDQFGDWTPDEAQDFDLDNGSYTPSEIPQAAFFTDPDIAATVTISTAKADEQTVDTAATRKANLMRQFGFNILNRRLEKLARTEDAPFVNASASYGDFFGAAESASISMFSDEQNWERALQVMEQELRRALEYGFTSSELAEQIANTRTGLKTAADSANTRSSVQLADGLVQSVHDARVFGRPEASLERFEAMIGDITPEAVSDAFNEAWGSDAPRIHLSLPEPLENAEEAILQTFMASVDVEVTPPEDTGAIAFAYTEFGPDGAVAERAVNEEVGFTEIRFENNVRLNVKQTDLEDETVRVSLRFGTGQIDQPLDQPGLDVLMSAAFTSGGLEAHSLDELQTILAGKNVGLGLGLGFDAFEARSRTTPTDLLTQLQVWAAYMTAPGYRSEGLAQYNQLVSAVYPTLDATPQGVSQIEVPRMIRSGDPRFGLASQDALAARTYEEIDAFLSASAADSAIEIAIVGDIAEEAAIDAVAKTFGALPARSAERSSDLEGANVSFPISKLGEVDTLRHEGQPNRALALVYWPGVDGSDDQLASSIDLMEEVMALKLIKRIREELGATYSPSSSVFFDDVNEGYGYISVSLDLEPQDVDELYEVVFEIAEEMRSGEVTEDERTRALTPILENIEESTERNGYWLALLDEAQSRPQDIANHPRQAEFYENTTVEDIVSLAQTYLDPADAYRIQILPPEAPAPESSE